MNNSTLCFILYQIIFRELLFNYDHKLQGFVQSRVIVIVRAYDKCINLKLFSSVINIWNTKLAVSLRILHDCARSVKLKYFLKYLPTAADLFIHKLGTEQTQDEVNQSK